MTTRNYDSHVRARTAFARKVAQHRIKDGMNPVASAKTRWASGKMPTIEALLPAAFEAIAAFEWPEGWGTKYSRLKIGGRPIYVDGQTRDVPARVARYHLAGLHAPPPASAVVADPDDQEVTRQRIGSAGRRSRSTFRRSSKSSPRRRRDAQPKEPGHRLECDLGHSGHGALRLGSEVGSGDRPHSRWPAGLWPAPLTHSFNRSSRWRWPTLNWRRFSS
jgi:hypothetical protein